MSVNYDNQEGKTDRAALGGATNLTLQRLNKRIRISIIQNQIIFFVCIVGFGTPLGPSEKNEYQETVLLRIFSAALSSVDI